MKTINLSNEPQFKVGDRIEYDGQHGTIISVDREVAEGYVRYYKLRYDMYSNCKGLTTMAQFDWAHENFMICTAHPSTAPEFKYHCGESLMGSADGKTYTIISRAIDDDLTNKYGVKRDGHPYTLIYSEELIDRHFMRQNRLGGYGDHNDGYGEPAPSVVGTKECRCKELLKGHEDGCSFKS